MLSGKTPDFPTFRTIKSSLPSAAYICQRTVSALLRIMVCYLFGAQPLTEAIWLIDNWTLTNKFQWNLNPNNISIHENAFENVTWEMAAILSRGTWVKICLIRVPTLVSSVRHLQGKRYTSPPCQHLVHQGRRLINQFPPFLYFPIFFTIEKYTLSVEYHVCIWQVSSQLSCGDSCQTWMWFNESNKHFCEIENLITEKSTNGA